jgi:broad specificity phosphatase PhoE
MIIRHAEKHQRGLHGRGVDEAGNPAAHELTVRGWERAGALVQFFTKSLRDSGKSAIQTPRSIFASAATKHSPSLRAMHTAGPLAAALCVEVNHDFAEGQEPALAAAVFHAPPPVLIVWHHGAISGLVREIAGEHIKCPEYWPEDRFDIVWILECGPEGSWSFMQVTQCLLPGDCTDVI